MTVADGFVPTRPTRNENCGDNLRAKRFDGFKFRRNHPLGPYFADFCCIKQGLIVELDGSQHGEPEEERNDAARTRYLSEQGYRVIRFLNEQVNRQLDEVLEAIMRR